MTTKRKPVVPPTDLKEQIKDALKKGKVQSPPIPVQSADAAEVPLDKPGFFTAKVRREEVVNFFQELGVLLDSGYSLLQALQVIGQHTTNGRFAYDIEQIAFHVEKGATFWSALSRHPWLFSTVDVNIIRAGEASGDLIDVIDELVENETRNRDIQETVFGALAYPATLAGVAVVVLILILFLVVPLFARNVEAISQDSPLPFLTGLIVFLSDTLVHWWYLVAILVVAAGYVVHRGLLSHGRVIDRWKLNTPLFGHVIVLGAMTQFVETLNILLRNGIPILESLQLAKGCLNNAYLETAVDRMIQNVEQGKQMADPLRQFHLIPQIAADMISVGEESGRLNEILEQLAKRFRTQLKRLIGRLEIFIEPLMLLLIGCVVLVVILALFLPYLQMVGRF